MKTAGRQELRHQPPTPDFKQPHQIDAAGPKTPGTAAPVTHGDEAPVAGAAVVRVWWLLRDSRVVPTSTHSADERCK
jgi:hypothetical protein